MQQCTRIIAYLRLHVSIYLSCVPYHEYHVAQVNEIHTWAWVNVGLLKMVDMVLYGFIPKNLSPAGW
jgi:hypothetical protein